MDVLCFGGGDWWYHNRGHFDMQMMRRFAKKGTTVYINSIVMQKLNVGQTRKFVQRLSRKAKSIFTGLKKTPEGFWVYTPFSLPVQHISWLKWLNEALLRLQLWSVRRRVGLANAPVVWVACPAACDLALSTKRCNLVYQRTDSFEDFPAVNRELIKQYDRKLKANADLTVYVNSTLYQSEASQCRRALYVDHGVDFESFASADASQVVPSDMAEIPRPIAGFIGSIDDCNPDLEFMEQVADLLPEVSFIFIGRKQTDCSHLEARKNVWMLGQKPYQDVPRYGKCFDVAILPLRQSPWTEAVNPLKLKEYLALGKPIISTPFNELSKYLDVVYEAVTPAEFARKIEQALSENTPELVARRRKKVQGASWDSKAETILQELFHTESSIS